VPCKAETDERLEPKVHPSFREALLFWWKLGWISFGGTAAHLAIMQVELVEKRRWIDASEFFHGLSHCMLLPGPEAQQLAIYIGWKLHGKLGGFLAGTLFVLPSTAILLGLSLLYAGYGTIWWVSLLFRLLKPIVVALVIRALFQIGRRALSSRLQWFAAVGSFLALNLLHVPLPWIVGAIVVIGAILGVIHGPRGVGDNASEAKAAGRGSVRRFWPALRIVGGSIAIGSVPLLLLRVFGGDFRFWLILSGFFTRTAFVTIGGSYTVLPYVAQAAIVKFSWLSHAEMLDGFALAETTPGPLIIVVGFVGFMAGFHHFHKSPLMGTVALLVTIFYTFLPCFLFVFIAAPWIAKSSESPVVRSMLRLIPAAVVAAILQLTVFLVRGAVFPAGQLDFRSVALVVGALIVIGLSSRHQSRSPATS
jgi:chromate transporter